MDIQHKLPINQIDTTTNTNNIKIEFVKSYYKEVNENNMNQLYDFYPLENTDKIYPLVEFRRKDPLGYIKVRNSNLFLYRDNKLIIIDGECPYVKQPLVIWFNYLYERIFVVYRFYGQGLSNIYKKRDPQNFYYLNYKEDGRKIYIKWTKSLDEATKFQYPEIIWSQIRWNNNVLENI